MIDPVPGSSWCSGAAARTVHIWRSCLFWGMAAAGAPWSGRCRSTRAALSEFRFSPMLAARCWLREQLGVGRGTPTHYRPWKARSLRSRRACSSATWSEHRGDNEDAAPRVPAHRRPVSDHDESHLKSHRPEVSPLDLPQRRISSCAYKKPNSGLPGPG